MTNPQPTTVPGKAAETPRTDKAATGEGLMGRPVPLLNVPADFARQLERELTAANQRAARLEEDGKRLDWLEESFNTETFEKVPQWFSVFADIKDDVPLREAIDSAMKLALADGAGGGKEV